MSVVGQFTGRNPAVHGQKATFNLNDPSNRAHQKPKIPRDSTEQKIITYLSKYLSRHPATNKLRHTFYGHIRYNLPYRRELSVWNTLAHCASTSCLMMEQGEEARSTGQSCASAIHWGACQGWRRWRCRDLGIITHAGITRWRRHDEGKPGFDSNWRVASIS